MAASEPGARPPDPEDAGPASRLDLLRGLRHELRTPINHVVGYSELLLDIAEDLGRPDLLADLAKIRTAGSDLLALVNDSLDSSRPADAPPPDVTALSQGLRTALNTIVGYSELLDDEAEAGDFADLRPDLQRIRAAGRQLLGPIHVLIDVTAAGTLDLPGETAPSRPAAPQPAVSPSVQAARLLVVDDDEANRDMLSRRLERLGFSVALAEDGRAALDRIAAEPFDLVLLDVVMPVLDGYGVLLHLKADDTLRHIPVIVLSASDELDSAVRCIELGAEDYLPKPVDAVLLRARIGACLEKKRLHDQEQEHLDTIQRMADELAEWNRTLERRVEEQVGQLERVGRLKRFLPQQIAETIVATGDESVLQSHRRQIAIVFCDLRGFTPFSEIAEPEDVMEVLNGYHVAMGELIARYDGTVEHFAGDGLMVLFNDPLPCPDPEHRAVRMALEMRERMTVLASGWRRRGYEVGFGVGIAMGYATLGRIGYEGRFHYAAIGSMVNLAARLCGEAKDGQILASRRVGLAVEDWAMVDPVGDLSLKGFRDPVPAVQIPALRDDASPEVSS
jgi:adenylate cyclase